MHISHISTRRAELTVDTRARRSQTMHHAPTKTPALRGKKVSNTRQHCRRKCTLDHGAAVTGMTRIVGTAT
jgi:hypothetical protein